jgi:hypothetical protein
MRVVLTVDLDLLLSLYQWTGAAQMLSQAQYSVEPGTEDSWAGPQYLYPPDPS